MARRPANWLKSNGKPRNGCAKPAARACGKEKPPHATAPRRNSSEPSIVWRRASRRLALEIARRVVRREIAVDPDALRGLVTAALEKLRGQDISRVKVHPSHAALLAACLKQAPGGNTVEVVADSSREPGAIIFETARGNLDASVDAQLQEIERGLVDRLRKQS